MTSKITYQGHLRCGCEHIQSGTRIETDAPTDNRGKGERFSPTDTVCVALATCMVTTMAIKAGDINIDLTGAVAEVTKHMLANPRRIGQIDVAIFMPLLEIGDEHKAYLQEIGDNCPVIKSLHTDLKINATYNWK
jgi:uncharacterized OsmC-like protein